MELKLHDIGINPKDEKVFEPKATDLLLIRNSVALSERLKN